MQSFKCGVRSGVKNCDRNSAFRTPNLKQRKVRESNPHLASENRVSTAARLTVSGYLPLLSDRGGSRTHKCQALDLTAIPVRLLGRQ